jgi:hypothetical protein
MTMKITHASYHGWSGGAARGGPAFKDPVSTARHADRAVWLTGQLEAPSWGVVQNYDGAAMSGGILNNIAVSPRDNSQGSCFALLRRIRDSMRPGDGAAFTTQSVQDLFAAFDQQGWTITEDNVLRTKADGRLVPGVVIRNVFSPPNGHVPGEGPAWEQTKKWLTLFFNVFADPVTYSAQSSYAISWLVAGGKKEELAVYQHYVDPHLDTWIGLQSTAMDPHLELAMCVYHSFSVNAPSEALLCLRHVPAALPVREFARTLVQLLGTRNYGAWHDNPQNTGNRYDRTRSAVWRRTDLWATDVAHDVMPENLGKPSW